MTDFVSRRKLVFTGSTGALGGMLIASNTAHAQETNVIREQSVQNFENADQAANGAITSFIGPLSDSPSPQIEPAVASIGRAREQISEAGVSDAPEELCRVEHIDLTQELIQNGVSTNPMDHELELLEEGVEPESEEFEVALVETILQAFGVDRGARTAFLNVIKRLELEGLIAELRAAAQISDWNRFERILSRFAQQLFGRAGLAALAQALDSEAYRRLLIAISARAVPFLGWAIFTISLGIAIYNNRERLFPQ